MTKTVRINHSSGTRKVELDAPSTVKRTYLFAKAPTPLKMNTKTVNWINEMIESTTDLNPELMEMQNAVELFTEISAYWSELDSNTELGDSDKVEDGGEFSDVPIDEYGMVDVEDMR
jgi:hypothetical protein